MVKNSAKPAKKSATKSASDYCSSNAAAGATVASGSSLPGTVELNLGPVYMLEGCFRPGKKPRSEEDFLLRLWFVHGRHEKSHFMRILSGQMVRHRRGVSLPGPLDSIVESQESGDAEGRFEGYTGDIDSDENLISGSPLPPSSDCECEQELPHTTAGPKKQK